jgi:hypothetical protein
MDAGQVWAIIGSVAGVVGVLVAVYFGVVQVRQGRKAADPDSGVSQNVRAGRDAYTAGRDQHISQNRSPDE